MTRPFIEFVQSQALPWVDDYRRSGRPGVLCKILSEDSEDHAATLLVRYPANWRGPTVEWCDVDEELFVLDGSLLVNGRTYGRHQYGYWPAGFLRRDAVVGSQGLTLIVALSGLPGYHDDQSPTLDWNPAALTEQVDPFAMRWDQTNMDKNIAHLNAWRKNLRLGPGGSGRTYLLAGLPQGYPATGAEPLERHPHIEEMFMIAGDMPCSLGIMRAGAYFWRPPHIWHGADCTVNGFLLFARTPGSNQTISEWSSATHTVRMDPEHRPHLPEHLRDAGAPAPDPITY